MSTAQRLVRGRVANPPTGGTATAGSTSPAGPGAAGSGPEHGAGGPRAETAGSTSPGSTGRTGRHGFPLPFTLDWPVFTAVRGRLAPTFAFAAGITALPDLQTTSLDEADLITSATQLGQLQHHREVAVLRVVMEGGAGRVTVGKAAQVIDFHTRLKPVADPDELDQAVTHLTEQAAGLRWEQLAKLARELSDQVRLPKDVEDHDQRRRDGRGLWFTGPNAAGMVGMSATLGPEGAAIIQSAIDPLSAPCPLTDAAGVKIEDDPRPPHQRRMDALLDIVGRGVSSPGAAPSTDKAKIVVTIDFEALRDWARHGCPPDWATGDGGEGGGKSATSKEGRGCGSGDRAGGGGGSCLSGDVLTAATVRRWACDAGIIPVVLGSDSAPLDVGWQERLVTRPMRTALWIRDGGCTFPGCSMPAQWTDAHHVSHWVHGGETKTSNLALLCRRHHTYVHDQDLTATITDTQVRWHTWQHWRTNVDPPPPPPAPPPPTPDP